MLGLHRGKKANITEVDKQIFEQKKLNIDTKLYKIFYYDESLNEWKFDSDSFDEFSVAKTLNIGNTLTPLVFYANLKEEDLKLFQKVKAEMKRNKFNFLNFLEILNDFFLTSFLHRQN